MPRNNVKKGELRQIREWLAKLTEEIIDIRDNHIHGINIKLNFVLGVLVPIIFVLVSCIVVVLVRQ